jgi:hypothetical protein
MAKLSGNQRRQLGLALHVDTRADAADEYETFGEDERLAREHVEYFYQEYLEDAGYLQ